MYVYTEFSSFNKLFILHKQNKSVCFLHALIQCLFLFIPYPQGRTLVVVKFQYN